ncbi:GGDEF domain-containing protein [Salinimonas marina]|uniref:diguanylate cyclase n=1 Tax=Salinimonas marina TaxID=2785918 RepID=A0A7S9DWF4_9ALTE|nr:GGDEF domain-containing protein [Salinimonas marina]QPG05115.1 GGDEF domain-containing protein [Salinimonas marina]
MHINEILLLQIAILGVIAAVGMMFTYALPAPSHKHKASSGLYARLFLFFVWLSYGFSNLQYIDSVLLYALGLNFCATLAAYMVYMTVLKRFGQPLPTAHRLCILLHLVSLEALTIGLHHAGDNMFLCQMLLLVSILIPVGMAALKMMVLMDQRSVGDKLLFYILSGAVVGHILGGPLYMFALSAAPEQQSFISFGLNVIVMIVFMLGFVVSVMHSLVIRLRKQIYRDPLTGCKNRNYFYDVAPALIKRAELQGQAVCMLVCDIDHFKQVNDSYGHLAGDKALRHFSQLLRSQLFRGDILIRMGGEEFLMLLVDCNLAQASARAEVLCQHVAAQPLQHDDDAISLTASFGLLALPAKADVFEIIGEADQALYQAKNQGRNQVVISQPVTKQSPVACPSLSSNVVPVSGQRAKLVGVPASLQEK